MLAARVVVTQALGGPAAERKLRARGIKALCPMYSREVRHARRTELKSYPLYSRYMFAWLEDDQLREVLSIRECFNVLRKAGSPRELAIVPDRVIEALDYCGIENRPFAVGEELIVKHGNWEGVCGLFSRDEDERVFLLFKMLGREVEIPFHRHEVGKTLYADMRRAD